MVKGKRSKEGVSSGRVDSKSDGEGKVRSEKGQNVTVLRLVEKPRGE